MMAGMEAATSAGSPHERRGTRREREAEFNRLLAFSDGVFAIAITLLVLQLEVPADSADLSEGLKDMLPALFAFAFSFAVLGRLWWVFHHRLFSGLEQFDGRLVGLNKSMGEVQFGVLPCLGPGRAHQPLRGDALLAACRGDRAARVSAPTGGAEAEE